MTCLHIRSYGPSEFTAGGPITGVVYVSIDDWAFPEDGWRDFVVTILGWWSETICSLSGSDTCRLSFMDGPFAIDVYRHDSDVRLRFVTRGVRAETVEKEAPIAYMELVRAIADACNGVATALLSDHFGAEAAKLRAAASAVLRHDG